MKNRKEQKNNIWKDRSGSALILAMTILIAGILIFSSITSISLLQRSASSKVRSSTEAIQIADGCIEWTLKKYYDATENDIDDPISTIGGFSGEFFEPIGLPVSITIGNAPNQEVYDIDCKIYLMGSDENGDGVGDIINDNTRPLSDIEQIRAVAGAGSGEDVARRAVQVGLSSCPDTVEDEDGNEYKTAKIGDQCWMAENLNVGTRIDSGNSMDGSDPIEKYCFDDDSSGTECDDYGGLYQWEEAMQGASSMDGIPGTVQGICPDGWHIPTDDEWHELELYLYTIGNCDPDRSVAWGECEIAGTELNSGGSSGFEALSSGWYDNDRANPNGTYYYQGGIRDSFWSSTALVTSVRSRLLRSDQAGVNRANLLKVDGHSVRCIKN